MSDLLWPNLNEGELQDLANRLRMDVTSLRSITTRLSFQILRLPQLKDMVDFVNHIRHGGAARLVKTCMKPFANMCATNVDSYLCRWCLLFF
jgi:hypothetical protein